MERQNSAVRVTYASESREITISFDESSHKQRAAAFDGIRFKVDFLASKEQSAAAWLVGTAILASLEMRTPGGVGLSSFAISHEAANSALIASLDARASRGDATAQYLQATLLLSECLRTSDETLLPQAKTLLISAAHAGDVQAAELMSKWSEVEAEHLERIRKSDS